MVNVMKGEFTVNIYIMKKYTYHMHLSILINFLCIGNNLYPINDRHAIQVWIATGECKMKIVLTRIVCISHLCVYVLLSFQRLTMKSNH